MGKNVQVFSHVNLYGCKIGAHTKIGAFVEIQKGVRIGKNCKISSHSFICEGVTIKDDVFIGHGVIFTNDKYPHATGDWKLQKTIVKKGASIGSGATILCGITIGAHALVGAGAVVTKSVAEKTTVVGNPAKII
jgi:acetyltransferase-like isoleucine patch superfamily enzyme